MSAQHVLCVLSWVFHQHNSHPKRAKGPGSFTDSQGLKVWDSVEASPELYLLQTQIWEWQRVLPPALPGEVFHHSAFITVCSCRSPPESVCITKYHSAALHFILAACLTVVSQTKL